MPCWLLLLCWIGAFLTIPFPTVLAQPAFRGPWQQDDFATQRFLINGTAGRNNPLRRELDKPFSGEELFVRYRIRYQADTIDLPTDGDGEFFVLWLDETEGNTGSTHAGNVPNIGLHVLENENRFMIRYNAGNQRFGPPLLGDRDYVVVARLWKSVSGESEPLDRLDLWVDPSSNAEFSPHASTTNSSAPSSVSWIGFSTGAKTEIDDVITVWDIDLAHTWEAILDLPATKTEKPPQPPPKTIDFTSQVHPLLARKCFRCHAGVDAESGLRLDIFDEVLSHTAPRNAGQSRLYQLAADGEMPPGGDVLNETELATLAKWIDEGLDWNEELLPTPVPKSDHWAFQPIKRPSIPQVANTPWISTPVDAFIAAKHEQAGLVANPIADQATLHRRMSLDLLGLPPEAAKRMRTIDELLTDTAHGERWARHWLDVARWAESNGHQHNRDRLHAWRYRDWVIDAINRDLPYDDFVRHQIAGDQISPYRDTQIIATGFLAAARYSGNELDKSIQRNDILVDIVNTTASAFLGLTLECAQCHTHKFDPISIRDYYRFQAFFAKGQPENVLLQPTDQARDLVSQRWHLFDSVQNRIVNVKRKQGHPEPIYVTPKSVIAGMRPTEKSRFNELERKIAELEQSWCFIAPWTASGDPVVSSHDMRWPLPRDWKSLARLPTHILIRGDVKSPGPTVEPGWPTVFGDAISEQSASRESLAQWLTGRDNPLAARVWVNRVWQWHFGRGLVESSNDLGTQGTPPSHPMLLDFLACELIEHNWSTRHIHRLIMQSSTYRQSSRYSAANAELDPDNRMLWRWSPRRLEAESIRDSMLAVSGHLDREAGGPSVSQESGRRSVYVHQKRDSLPAQQVLFDGANGNTSCSRRRISTNGLQPLWLMNSDFMQLAARGLASRAGSVETAFRLALGREPAVDELQQLETLAREYGLESSCLAILNSSEFLYIP